MKPPYEIAVATILRKADNTPIALQSIGVGMDSLNEPNEDAAVNAVSELVRTAFVAARQNDAIEQRMGREMR